MIHGVLEVEIQQTGAEHRQGGAITKISFQRIAGNMMVTNRHAVLTDVAGQLQVMLIAVLIILLIAGRITTKVHATQPRTVHGLQAVQAAVVGAEINLTHAHL